MEYCILGNFQHKTVETYVWKRCVYFCPNWSWDSLTVELAQHAFDCLNGVGDFAYGRSGLKT